jgi:hypothetical protein
MHKLGQDPNNNSFSPIDRYDLYNLSNNMFDLYHPQFLWGLPEQTTGQYQAAVSYFNFNDIINLGDSEPDYNSLNNVVKRMDGMMAICYDTDKVIEILMEDMSEDEAWEYFEYNVLGAWVGEHTPVFLEIGNLG